MLPMAVEVGPLQYGEVENPDPWGRGWGPNVDPCGRDPDPGVESILTQSQNERDNTDRKLSRPIGCRICKEIHWNGQNLNSLRNPSSQKNYEFGGCRKICLNHVGRNCGWSQNDYIVDGVMCMKI